MIVKIFNASMPCKNYAETDLKDNLFNMLKLVTYGTAFITYHKDFEKEYNIVNINEIFKENTKAETLTLFIKLEMSEKAKA